jgi:hypothetical protein
LTALEPLSHLISITSKNFSNSEKILLEADLFARICEQLKIFFKEKHTDFFLFMNFTKEMEDNMMEENLIKFIINDIVHTEEYTAPGIANYTGIHEDVINDLSSGLNTKPLAINFRKMIELHRTVRPALYQLLAKKIIYEYQKTCSTNQITK